MRSVRELVVLAGVLLAGAGGCIGGDDDADTAMAEGPYTTLTERPCPDGSYLTWENFGEPFLLDWCTGCHASGLTAERRAMAPVEVNLDELDSVRANMDRIWHRAADQNATMPPAGGPGEAERELLGEWLACGAPSRPEL